MTYWLSQLGLRLLALPFQVDNNLLKSFPNALSMVCMFVCSAISGHKQVSSPLISTPSNIYMFHSSATSMPAKS